MELVVTSQQRALEESTGFPSLLLLLGVAFGSAGFLLGWFCCNLHTRFTSWEEGKQHTSIMRQP